MRPYARVSPTFWTGKTGKELRAKGTEAIVTAWYLMTAPGSNMLGLYYQPLLYMAHETGLGIDGTNKGLRWCIEAGFCRYDPETEMVWVIEMAAYQIADKLKAADLRCTGIQREYDNLQENPYLGDFFDRYRYAFHLKDRRGGQGPSDPLGSKEKEKEQEKEQEKEKSHPLTPANAGEGKLVLDGKPGKPKRVREKMPFTEFIKGCRERKEKPIPVDDPIFKFAELAGIPVDYLELAWREFAAKHKASGRMQKDWRAHFRDAVRRNWFKLWWFPSEGQCDLTTSGVQIKRERDAERTQKAQA